MTDIMSATILAIIAHLAPTIAALAALIQGLRNGRKAAVIVTKTSALVEETGKVHEAVNSNLDAVKAELAAANLKIKELSSLVVKITEVKERHD